MNYGFLVENNIDSYFDLDVEYNNPLSIPVHIIDEHIHNSITNPPEIHLNKHNMVGTLKLLWWQRLCNLSFSKVKLLICKLLLNIYP